MKIKHFLTMIPKLGTQALSMGIKGANFLVNPGKSGVSFTRNIHNFLVYPPPPLSIDAILLYAGTTKRTLGKYQSI